ncbi:MAG: sulfotransferase family protein [Betaproteobacteria bacterium CG2_30_68_42]|nr:MAG: sulfotransferase family protein [Betaproteobacteria bacterium CG2_30_68_42]
MPDLRKLAKLADSEIRAKNLLELKRGLKAVVWSLMRPAVPDPVFVIGCSRAGTTVTYETLAASGRFLHFGYELPQFWNGLTGPLNNGWESEAARAEHARPGHRDAALRFFYQRLGAGRVLDKTCINTMRVGYLHALFPQATFVFIHRDGRDNVSSMMDGWRHGRTDGDFGLEKFFGLSPESVAIDGGRFREWHFFLPPGWRDYNQTSLEEVCAFQWISANRLALEARRDIPEAQWIELRYEDIFERPVEMFRGAFERLGLPFDEAMRARCASLGSRPTSIVKGGPKQQKWKEHNPEAIERILPVIRPMMERLGYDPDA